MRGDVKQPIILQTRMPDGQMERAQAPLPSMAPVNGRWLFQDEAYGAQMALRRRLLRQVPHLVLGQLPDGLEASQRCFEMFLEALPEGFERVGNRVICPDGVTVTLDPDAPLMSLGQIFQQDICILQKQGAEHVLTGAVLCFPASWTLNEKLGKPMMAIHRPVGEYDSVIARRVQRLLDCVQPGRPIWRANALRYASPDLYHPRTEGDPRPNGAPDAPYLRSERQTILHLPVAGAVAFMIHTTVLWVADAGAADAPCD